MDWVLLVASTAQQRTPMIDTAPEYASLAESKRTAAATIRQIASEQMILVRKTA